MIRILLNDRGFSFRNMTFTLMSSKASEPIKRHALGQIKLPDLGACMTPILILSCHSPYIMSFNKQPIESLTRDSISSIESEFVSHGTYRVKFEKLGINSDLGPRIPSGMAL